MTRAMVVALWTGYAAAAQLTVVNYSEHAIPATAVTVDAKVLGAGPVQATRNGAPLRVSHGDGVVRIYLGFKARETARIDVQPAASWGPPVGSAQGATIDNGIVTLRMRDGKWDLLFDGDGPERDRTILFAGGYYGWIDNMKRGRVSDTRGFDPAKDDARDPGPDGAGMISTRLARTVSTASEVKPNGDVELEIVKTFESFGKAITWTETYTLVAGLPLLRYRTKFENSGDAPIYIAYVGRGGWFYARYGPALANNPRLLSDQKTPDLPLGGESVRIAWIPESAWSAVESDSGMGVALATLHRMPKSIMTGSMVWQFGATSFSLPLVEHSQGQYPWEVTKERPAETGIAVLATMGVPAWTEGKSLLAGSAPATAYAVFSGSEVMQTASITGPARVPGAFTLDFGKRYVVDGPVTLRALDGQQETIRAAAGVDLTEATGWKGSRRVAIEATAPATLRRKAFGPPSVISPADGASITDLASFFKWAVQADARGYEFEIARDRAFTGAKPVFIKGDTHYLPAEPPTPGKWFWRVRSVAPGITGEWTQARALEVNARRAKAPVLRPISAERPLFTIEAGDHSDFRKLAKAIPEDLRPYFAVVAGDKTGLPELLAPAKELGISVLLRTHHPSPVDGWTPLGDVEAAFRDFPNVIGIQGGEALGSWYGDRETARYVQRLVQLAVQYGRIVHEGDGCYDENKWQEIYEDPVAAPLVRSNYGHIAFSQKNNIFNKQLMTQSAVVGQYLAGTIANSGAWEDGGWYWAQVGFRKLGESFGARTGRQHDMPPIFWDLTFLMGLARGSTVYSMDGQGGVFMRGHYDPSNPAHPKEVLWTSEGDQAPAFRRFVLPFLRGIVQHRMIPSREDVLANVKLAVTYDGARDVKQFKDDRYREFWALYAGTYGFRQQGSSKGEIWEYFPNTGRYHFIPILPPGASLAGVRPVAIGSLQDPAAVRKLFDTAYPQWYSGDAWVERAGDLLAVMNTHENEDVTERYSVPVNRGILRSVSGTVPVHSYVMGKFEDGGRRLWLQVNGNYPEREMAIAFACEREPRVEVAGPGAVTSREWDGREMKLTLSPAAGYIELNVEIGK